jgi:hypothetical protein
MNKSFTGFQDAYFIMKIDTLHFLIRKAKHQPESGYPTEKAAILDMIKFREESVPEFNTDEYNFTIIKLYELK